MFEEIFNNQENSKSILIIDDFEHEATLLIFAIINNYIQRNTHLIDLYPSFFKVKDAYEKHFSTTNVNINEYLVTGGLFDEQHSQLIFQTILKNLNKNRKSDSDSFKKSNLIFDNLNLIMRNFNNDPFKLIQFIIETMKRSDVNHLVMRIHANSLDSTILNQIKSQFQTVISVKDTKQSLPQLKTNNFKYNIEITHRNLKTGQVKMHEETVYLNEKFKIEKVEKIVKLGKVSKEANKDEDEDVLKGLTFNVRINEDDLEAKKNLVLPYELINQKKVQIQIKQEEKAKEEAKIYYAPDERDDVDDDDPDDDLNF